MNVQIFKWIMFEKETRLPLLRNQIIKAKTEKNKQMINTYLNEQYHGIKRK